MKKFINSKFIISAATIIIILVGIVMIDKKPSGSEPEDIVYGFLSATTVEERKQYVLNDETMPEYFTTDGVVTLGEEFEENKKEYIFEKDYLKYGLEVEEGSYTRVNMYYKSGNGRSEDVNSIFYLKKTKDGFLIDFKPSVLNNNIKLPDYFLDNNNNSETIKVYAKLDDYNFKKYYDDDELKENGIEESVDGPIPNKYNDAKDFYTIAVKDPVTGYVVQGLVKKNTKEGEYLYTYLKEGGYKQVMLNVSNLSRDRELDFQLKINDIISFDWSGMKEYKFRDW